MPLGKEIHFHVLFLNGIYVYRDDRPPQSPRRDGTTQVAFEPVDFIARLAALVPKPRALFSEDAAFHLSESKLSEDQRIINKRDGKMLVKATINNTMELRW